MKRKIKNTRQSGFSMLEMMVVVAMAIIITVIAIPSYISTSAYLRAAGDVRAINGLTAQAKMRAAADFTRARIYADLNGNDYQLQVWSKTGNAGAGCWVADSDPTSTCLTYTSGTPSGTPLNLSQGDTFGFGTLTAGPTPGQTTIGQAAQCLDNGGTAIASTACVVFNSRGIPINPTTLAPAATGALYITNGTIVNGVTVSATGSIQTWSTPLSATHWTGQ